MNLSDDEYKDLMDAVITAERNISDSNNPYSKEVEIMVAYDHIIEALFDHLPTDIQNNLRRAAQ